MATIQWTSYDGKEVGATGSGQVDWAWATALVAAGLVASTSNAALGIGGGLLVMPILALWFPPAEAVTYTIPMFFLSAVVNWWRYRHQVERQALLWLAPGVLVGIVFGTLLLRLSSPALIRGIMGGIAILFAGHEAIRLLPQHVSRPLPAWVGVPLSVASGVASALTNIGGTILSLALLGWDLSPPVFVGTVNTIMVGMSAAKIVGFSSAGLMTWRGALLALPSMPTVLLGSALGQRLNQRLSPVMFRWALVAVIGASAILLVLGY
jgi:uncharacterized membrane protein YfcA